MPGHDLPMFLLTLVALLVLTSVRTCGHTERVAVHTPQGWAGLFGPGIYLRWPWQLRASKHTRLQIGDAGRYLGDGWARINGARMPVISAHALDPDRPIRIESFRDRQVVVAPDPTSPEPAAA